MIVSCIMLVCVHIHKWPKGDQVKSWLVCWLSNPNRCLGRPSRTDGMGRLWPLTQHGTCTTSKNFDPGVIVRCAWALCLCFYAHSFYFSLKFWTKREWFRPSFNLWFANGGGFEICTNCIYFHCVFWNTLSLLKLETCYIPSYSSVAHKFAKCRNSTVMEIASETYKKINNYSRYWIKLCHMSFILYIATAHILYNCGN